jgi:MinD superfamily P-loop ATPase
MERIKMNTGQSIVVISGKGGTGKTTITASLAHLMSKDIVKADCDVDASNLGIILDGKTEREEDYYGAKVARINDVKCLNCGQCQDVCRYNAIEFKQGKYHVKTLKCEGCNACVVKCPNNAIQLLDEKTGKIQVKETNNGKLVTSVMIPGAEGSGKLVTEVRKSAKNYGIDLLIDGSPGVGCSVMASVTGTNYAIIVTEPTQSAYEDLVRVHEIVKHFNSKALLIINKYDINEKMTNKIEKTAKGLGIQVLGRIPFDPIVNQAVNELNPIIKYHDSEASKALVNIYEHLKEEIS